MVVVASLLLRWADPAPPDGSDSEIEIDQLPGYGGRRRHQAP
jgi:hypothetical protein